MTTAKKVTTRNQRIHCKPISYDRFQTWSVRRFRNSQTVNLAIHRNMAYVILEARTILLPISRCCISSGESPSVIALFVPHNNTKCTNPILAHKGMMASAMILSSWNSFSVRTNLPRSRTMMIANANPVHHHDTRSVGLSWCEVWAAGGLEYRSRWSNMATWGPPTGLRRGVSAESGGDGPATRAWILVRSLIFSTAELGDALEPCSCDRFFCLSPQIEPRSPPGFKVSLSLVAAARARGLSRSCCWRTVVDR